MGINLTIDMTWGCLILLSLSKKRPKNQSPDTGVPAKGDWASALWLQQHSESAFTGGTPCSMVWRDNLEGHIVRSYWKLDKRPQGSLGCWQAVRRVSDLLQMAETPWKTDFMSKFVPSAIQSGICHTKWEIKLGTNVTILVQPLPTVKSSWQNEDITWPCSIFEKDLEPAATVLSEVEPS